MFQCAIFKTLTGEANSQTYSSVFIYQQKSLTNTFDIMKKVILASTLAVIIVLAGFSGVASARTIDRDDLIENINVRVLDDNWYPGKIINMILAILEFLTEHYPIFEFWVDHSIILKLISLPLALFYILWFLILFFTVGVPIG